MATFDIKEEKNRVVVTVSLPSLPPRAADSASVREVVRPNHVRQRVEERGIKVFDCLQSPGPLSNFSGNACTGEFIFSTIEKTVKTGGSPPPQRKSLTEDSKPAIIKKDSNSQRKRAKRETRTGKKTTS